MTTNICGECVEWTRTVHGRRKDDDVREHFCHKGNRLVCQSMLAANCFAAQQPAATKKLMRGTCGQCAAWTQAYPGRRSDDHAGSRVCLSGGKVVYPHTQADPFCFTRQGDAVLAVALPSFD